MNKEPIIFYFSKWKGNCYTHIYKFSFFTSGSRRSENSMQSYCKNAINNKKPHNFRSIQRVGKRLLHRTYRWRTHWFFLGNHFIWFSNKNTKDFIISKRKEKTVKSRNKYQILELNVPLPSRKWPTKWARWQQQSYCN